MIVAVRKFSSPLLRMHVRPGGGGAPPLGENAAVSIVCRGMLRLFDTGLRIFWGFRILWGFVLCVEALFGVCLGV